MIDLENHKLSYFVDVLVMKFSLVLLLCFSEQEPLEMSHYSVICFSVIWLVDLVHHITFQARITQWTVWCSLRGSSSGPRSSTSPLHLASCIIPVCAWLAYFFFAALSLVEQNDLCQPHCLKFVSVFLHSDVHHSWIKPIQLHSVPAKCPWQKSLFFSVLIQNPYTLPLSSLLVPAHVDRSAYGRSSKLNTLFES